MPEQTVENRLRSLRIDDVMNHAVVRVSESSTMEEIAEHLRQHDVSSAPVVDGNGSCVGMISASDFLKRDARIAAGENIAPADDLVGNHMAKGVQSIGLNELMLKAAVIMCATHLHHLPVMDDDQQLVGVISTMDIAAAVVNAIDEMDGTFLKRQLLEGAG